MRATARKTGERGAIHGERILRDGGRRAPATAEESRQSTIICDDPKGGPGAATWAAPSPHERARSPLRQVPGRDPDPGGGHAHRHRQRGLPGLRAALHAAAGGGAPAADGRAGSGLRRRLRRDRRGRSARPARRRPRPCSARGRRSPAATGSLRFLARGGMGEVYEAEDLELRERIALKTIQPDGRRRGGRRSSASSARSTSRARSPTRTSVGSSTSASTSRAGRRGAGASS